jgi:hypothetical protein
VMRGSASDNSGKSSRKDGDIKDQTPSMGSPDSLSLFDIGIAVLE